MGKNVRNHVGNKDGGHSTHVFSNSMLLYQGEMPYIQLHAFDSSLEDVLSHFCCCISLECINEDKSESDNNPIVDLSSSELLYTTQKLSITNDIVTCSNVRGVIEVDDDYNTSDPIINK